MAAARVPDPDPADERLAPAPAVAVRSLDMKLLRSINLDIATWEHGAVNHYRNMRWFERTDNSWVLVYWFNDDVTDLVAIAAADE